MIHQLFVFTSTQAGEKSCNRIFKITLARSIWVAQTFNLWNISQVNSLTSLECQGSRFWLQVLTFLSNSFQIYHFRNQSPKFCFNSRFLLSSGLFTKILFKPKFSLSIMPDGKGLFFTKSKWATLNTKN